MATPVLIIGRCSMKTIQENRKVKMVKVNGTYVE